MKGRKRAADRRSDVTSQGADLATLFPNVGSLVLDTDCQALSHHYADPPLVFPHLFQLTRLESLKLYWGNRKNGALTQVTCYRFHRRVRGVKALDVICLILHPLSDAS